MLPNLQKIRKKAMLSEILMLKKLSLTLLPLILTTAKPTNMNLSMKIRPKSELKTRFSSLTYHSDMKMTK